LILPPDPPLADPGSQRRHRAQLRCWHAPDLKPGTCGGVSSPRFRGNAVPVMLADTTDRHRVLYLAVMTGGFSGLAAASRLACPHGPQRAVYDP
jgi:hypothetical protein